MAYISDSKLAFPKSKFSKTYGGMSVSLCMAYCLSNGYVVSYPLFDDAKYDLIVDISDKLQRVQCKTSMVFTARKIRYPRVHFSHGSQRSYSRNDFDYLWVITQEHAYFIPVENIPLSQDDQLVEIVLSQKFNGFIVDMPFLSGKDPKRTLEMINLTDTERARIASLYRLGESDSDIAMTMGLKQSQVRGYLNNANIVKEHFVTDEIKEKIIESYKSGLGIRDISKQVNFSRSMIGKVIEQSGTPLRRKAAIKPEWKQKIIEMYVSGKKPEEIAKYYGIRRSNTVSSFLHKHKWLIDETRTKLSIS